MYLIIIQIIEEFQVHRECISCLRSFEDRSHERRLVFQNFWDYLAVIFRGSRCLPNISTAGAAVLCHANIFFLSFRSMRFLKFNFKKEKTTSAIQYFRSKYNNIIYLIQCDLSSKWKGPKKKKRHVDNMAPKEEEKED